MQRQFVKAYAKFLVRKRPLRPLLHGQESQRKRESPHIPFQRNSTICHRSYRTPLFFLWKTSRGKHQRTPEKDLRLDTRRMLTAKTVSNVRSRVQFPERTWRVEKD